MNLENGISTINFRTFTIYYWNKVVDNLCEVAVIMSHQIWNNITQFNTILL